MAEPFFARLRRRMGRFLRVLFALDPGPADLAAEVADRLFDPSTPDERIRLRQMFGADPETIAVLEKFISPTTRRAHGMAAWRALTVELRLTGQLRGYDMPELAASHSATRRLIRDIEGAALIRLYRWEYRKHRLPALRRRLARRVADAHRQTLEALCDAPPIRQVLVGWHDQLVDGRRTAGEIAEPPDPVRPDDPEEEAVTRELVLAAKLRRALWAHAKGRRAARRQEEAQAGRDGERAKALGLLLDASFNAQSIRAMAESLLRHARRMALEGDETIPQLLDPAEDRDAEAPLASPAGSATPWRDGLENVLERDPALADSIVEDSGMPLDELWARAVRLRDAAARAERSLRLLVDATMPLVAEIAVDRGLRGRPFLEGVEQGRAALLHVTDRFCFAGPGDYGAAAKQAVRAAFGEGADGS